MLLGEYVMEMSLLEYCDRTGTHCDQCTFNVYKGMMLTPEEWEMVLGD